MDTLQVVAPTSQQQESSRKSIWERVPARHEFTSFYVAFTVPVHTVALLVFFQHLPGLLLRLYVIQTLAVLCYILMVAMFESLLIAGLLSLACIATPEKFFKRHCAAQGSVLAWGLIVGILPFFLDGYIQIWLTATRHPSLKLVWAIVILAWIPAMILVVLYCSKLLRRSPGFEQSILAVVDRFSVLAGLYLLLDLIAIAVIIVRNLVWAI